MATIILRKGERVGFDHQELGWVEGTLLRASPDAEEWLVRTRLGDRWVPLGELRPPRAPQRMIDHAH